MAKIRMLAPVLTVASIAIAIVFVGSLASHAAAQERTTVEVVQAEVIRVFGTSVFLRGEDGEIKRYDEIPEGVTVTVDGEEVELSDLREGMILTATLENVPPPVVVTMADVEAATEEPAATPAEPEPAEPEPAPEPAQEAPAEETDESSSNLILWGGLLLLVVVIAAFLFMRKGGN